MGTTEDVEETLPGLKFSVVSSSTTKGSITRGDLIGTITLRCQVSDSELWDRAVEQFEGFKVFSSTSEELRAALSSELDETEAKRRELVARALDLELLLIKKDREIADLRKTLAAIGHNLGIE